MVLPALKALGCAFPDDNYEMHLLVQKAFVPLLTLPGSRWKIIEDTTKRPEKGNWWRWLKAIWRGERQKSIQAVLKGCSQNGETPFAMAITFTREIDYQRAFYRVGIPQRFGWKQPELVWLGKVNRPVEPISRSSDPGKGDQVKYFMRMAEGVYEKVTQKPWPPASISPRPKIEIESPDSFLDAKIREVFSRLAAQDKDEAKLRELEEGKRAYFTLVTTTSKGSTLKRWPLQRFLEVAMAIAMENNWVPIFSFGPGEQKAYETLVSLPGWAGIAAEHGAIAVPPGDLDLHQFLALLARSKFLLTNDTGPRHVALALGTRTVTIFGPSPPGRAVHAPHLERAIKLHDECKATCNIKKDHCRYGDICLGMQAITPRMVSEHVREFLDAC